jgi:CheY-like chemotaxis protein
MTDEKPYLLLIEADQRMLDLQVAALSYFYSGEVVSARSSAEALEIFTSRDFPELIFADFEILRKDLTFYQFVDDNELNLSFVAYTENEESHRLHRNFPYISSIIDKPFSMKSFAYIVKGLITSPVIAPTHIPIKLNLILNFASSSFDYFLKLSGTNFVKMFNRGEALTLQDADRLHSKGVSELYIQASDSHDFFCMWEKQLEKKGDSALTTSVFMETIEQFEGLAKALGWNRQVIQKAQQVAAEAIKQLSTSSRITQELNARLSDPTSTYTRHVGLQTFLLSVISSEVDWVGEQGQLKLAMAALLHDLSVADHYYDDIQTWNAKASDFKDRTPESTKYRLHPLEASKFIEQHPSLPPDLEKILLQHHERPDGSGFPRGLDAKKISSLSSLFILVEDFVEFVEEAEHLETGVTDFITWAKEFYQEGPFERSYETFRSKIHVK